MFGKASTLNKTVIDIDFILARENIKFDIASDGLPYAILDDSCYSYEYRDLSNGWCVGHWGQYDNCVGIQRTIGL